VGVVTTTLATTFLGAITGTTTLIVSAFDSALPAELVARAR
jgi:hypothetical protein